MGLIRMGPPKKLILQLRDKYELRDFIETGTYYGNTAVWAASYFDNVTTIEYSQEIYEEAVARHDKTKNINFIFGDSRSVLKTAVQTLTHPAVFWLDSHWSGGQTYGQDDECPLIEEIRIINASKYDHFVFIDDARLFTSPPPMPHLIEQWPSIDKVIDALKYRKHQQHYIVIFEDVVISVPKYVKELIASYCQEINTKAWQEYGKRLKESAIKQGCGLIGQGLRSVGRGLRVWLRHLASNLMTSMIRK